jgi:hypothetical protein
LSSNVAAPAFTSKPPVYPKIHFSLKLSLTIEGGGQMRVPRRVWWGRVRPGKKRFLTKPCAASPPAAKTPAPRDQTATGRARGAERSPGRRFDSRMRQGDSARRPGPRQGPPDHPPGGVSPPARGQRQKDGHLDVEVQNAPPEHASKGRQGDSSRGKAPNVSAGVKMG